MYKEFISQLCIHVKAIRILTKGYLPILLITPPKLKEILDAVKSAIQKKTPVCYLAINSLHLYYDIVLVTFGIDRDGNLIIQFPCIHTAIHTTTTNTVPDRNSTRPYNRSQHTSTFVHTSIGR